MKPSLRRPTLRYALLLLLVLSVTNPSVAQRWLSRAEATELITKVLTTLLYEHPAAQRPEVRPDLQTALTYAPGDIAQLTGKRDSVTFLSALSVLQPVENLLHDGNTQLQPRYLPEELDSLRRRTLPLHLVKPDDYPHYVTYGTVRTETGKHLPRGTGVIAVDGTPVEHWIDSMSVLSGYQDLLGNATAAYNTALGFGLNYERYGGLVERIELVVADSSGRRDTVSVRPQPRGSITTTTPATAPLIRLSYFKQDSTILLQLGTFSSRALDRARYGSILRKLFRELSRTPGKRLLIDVRGNAGGSFERAGALFSYLTPVPFTPIERAVSVAPSAAGRTPQERYYRYLLHNIRPRKGLYHARRLEQSIRPASGRLQFAGPVIVLVDELTYGPGAMFANWVQQTGRGQVIGRPGGASMSYTYAGGGRRLNVGPRGAYRLSYLEFELTPAFQRAGGLQPDVLVPFLLEDHLQPQYPPRILKLGIDLLGQPTVKPARAAASF